MKYYKNTCQFIIDKSNNANPTENINEMPGYLIWMINQMQTFTDALKAARWIGWILAHAELQGFMDNETSRNLIRSDVAEQNDR